MPLRMQSLPADDVSRDNAILISQCRRWPLLIDPQMQGTRWLEAKEASRASAGQGTHLRRVHISHANMLRSLEACIRSGTPVLLEGVGDTLPPVLQPLLQKQITRQVCINDCRSVA